MSNLMYYRYCNEKEKAATMVDLVIKSCLPNMQTYPNISKYPNTAWS